MRSSFAAMMKSFSCKPLIFFVREDSRVAPAEADVRMVPFGLDEISSFLHEGECFSKVLELEGPLDPSRFFLNAPFGRPTSSGVSGGMPPRHGVQDFAARDEASRAIGTSLRSGLI